MTMTPENQWKPIDTWSVGEEAEAISVSVSLSGSAGNFRFRAAWGGGDIEDVDLSRLFHRVKLEAGVEEAHLDDWRKRIAAFEGFGMPSKAWRGREETNAAAAIRLIHDEVGLMGPRDVLAECLERQTEGKTRRGWINATFQDVVVRLMVFFDASAVALIGDEDESQVLPLVLDLSKAFRAEPSKTYKATLAVRKDHAPNENDAQIVTGEKDNQTVITMPVDLKDLPDGLRGDLEEVVANMLTAREVLSDLPAVRRPLENEVDDGSVVRLDGCGIWKNAKGAFFWWPNGLPHRAIRRDALDPHRELVKDHVQLMLWADPEIISPVRVRISTRHEGSNDRSVIDIDYNTTSGNSYDYKPFVGEVERHIASAIPDFGTAIGFETHLGARSATTQYFLLMEMEVDRPSAAQAAMLERRWGTPFSGQPGYRPPANSTSEKRQEISPADADGPSEIKFMAGGLLGHPGAGLHVDHDALGGILDDEDVIFNEPSWATLSGGVASTRFEREVGSWSDGRDEVFFPAPVATGEGWSFSILVSDEGDAKCLKPLGAISAWAAFSPLGPKVGDDEEEREAFLLSLKVEGLCTRLGEAAEDEAGVLDHKLLSALIEGIKHEILKIEEACAHLGEEVEIEVSISCARHLAGDLIIDLLTRAFGVVGDELRDPVEGPARVFLSVEAEGWEEGEDQPAAEPKAVAAAGIESRSRERWRGGGRQFDEDLSVIGLPRGTLESVYGAHADIFVRTLEGHLGDLGVSLRDLEPREITLWDPTESFHGSAQWMPRESTHPDRLLAIQASFVKEDENARRYGWDHGEREENALAERLCEASTRLEVLALWVLGALAPLLRQRSRIQGVERGLHRLRWGSNEALDMLDGQRLFELAPDLRLRHGFRAMEALKLAEEISGGGDFSSYSGRWALQELALPSDDIIASYSLDVDGATRRGEEGGRLPLMEYLAGTIALNARMSTPVRLTSSPEAPEQWIREGVEAVLSARAEVAHRRAADAEAERQRIAAMSPLEKRHHKLSRRWREIVSPGAVDLDDIGDRALLALNARMPKDALSVFLGLSLRKFEDALRNARMNLRPEQDPADLLPKSRARKARQMAFVELSREELSALASRYSLDAISRVFETPAHEVREALSEAEQHLFGPMDIPEKWRGMVAPE